VRFWRSVWLSFDFSRFAFLVPRPALLVLKVKTVGLGRQPGNFLSKAKESNQRRLCAALGTSCTGSQCVN
jgi:hypothetical protein